MSPRNFALVEPALLAWARSSAGFTVESAAPRLGVTVDRLRSWESGAERLTLPQLRKAAQVYRRPIGVFYLPAPPADFDALRDFRRLPGTDVQEESPALRFEVRLAHERREAAIEISTALGDPPPEVDLRVRLAEAPEAVAGRIRSWLGLDDSPTQAATTEYEALAMWKATLEAKSVLVFQTSGVSMDEARGFSIGKPVLPVVVVNSNDSPRGRVFTMFHEVVHVLLRQDGLCDLEEAARLPEDQRVEVYCNAVAAATLVPKSVLISHEVAQKHGASVRWTDDELSVLARYFAVSQEVVLRRLLTLERTTSEFYQQKRSEFIARYRGRRRPTGGPPPAVKAVARVGRPFVRLVFEGLHRDVLTLRDATDLLEVRTSRLDEVAAVASAAASEDVA